MKVEVFTLGDFDIMLEGESVLQKSHRANKNLDLLRYFITFRDKKLLPESIIEDLWRDGEAVDLKNALRVQIFRLRKNLRKKGLIKEGNGEGLFNIVFENGYYFLKWGKECTFDSDKFEEKIRQADALKDSDLIEALRLYREAIELYRGQYLIEDPYSEWVIPARNRYHRIYVQTILKLMELLKTNGLYSEMVELYEQAVTHEIYEEGIHIYFLEALMELNQYNYALSHYQYITREIYREFSVEPSPAMKKIYKKLIEDKDPKRFTNLFFIGQKLCQDDDMRGALYCDVDYFRVIYNLERRKNTRSHSNKFLCLISIIEEHMHKHEKEHVMQILLKILQDFLERAMFFAVGTLLK